MSVLVQQPAPEFKMDAVLADGLFGSVNLSDYKGKKYVLLFFYPFDFTFVCPTEIIAFSDRNADFDKLGVQVWEPRSTASSSTSPGETRHGPRAA